MNNNNSKIIKPTLVFLYKFNTLINNFHLDILLIRFLFSKLKYVNK